jgi:small GTP-binding protein
MENIVKVSLVGAQNVGKTAVKNLLEGHPMDPTSRDPTIGVGFGKVIVDDKTWCLWDYGGQKQFRFMWDAFLKGTKLTIVVTDSTEKNVEETKEMITRFNRFEGSKVIALANKQDLPGALSPDAVSQRLGIKAYGTVAVDAKNMGGLLKILKTEM